MDKYYVYRPLLDLIGYTEGTDEGEGYNETLAYGKFTGGSVNLIGMTLDRVDVLQTKMLAHPENHWNSSAAGRYQIVRTTRRDIQHKLNIPGSSLFDKDMQDRMGCYLLGKRGIDKWLEGELHDNAIVTNLAMEWASLPMPSGRSYYGGQSARVDVLHVMEVLAEVKKRWVSKDHPYTEIPTPVIMSKPRLWLLGLIAGAIALTAIAAALLQ